MVFAKSNKLLFFHNIPICRNIFFIFWIIVGMLDVNCELSIMEALCGTNHPQPNVAYCMSGLARSLRTPNVYVSFKKNLMESFGGNFSLFLNIEIDKKKSKENMLNELREPLAYLKPYIQALNLYHGRNGTEIAKLINPNCHLPPNSANGNSAYFIRTLHQHACIQQCFGLIEQYEQKNKMQFDWVVRVRTDMVYFEGIMPYCLHDPDAVETGLYDRLNIVPRKYADVRFKLLQEYQRLNGSYNFHNAEALLYGILGLHKIGIREVSIFLGVSRFPDSNSHSQVADPLLTYELVGRKFGKEGNLRIRTIQVYHALQPELSLEECTRQVDEVIERVKKQHKPKAGPKKLKDVSGQR